MTDSYVNLTPNETQKEYAPDDTPLHGTVQGAFDAQVEEGWRHMGDAVICEVDDDRRIVLTNVGRGSHFHE